MHPHFFESVRFCFVNGYIPYNGILSLDFNYSPRAIVTHLYFEEMIF